MLNKRDGNFAGFFCYNELCNIAPKHIEFHSDYIEFSCLVVRQMFIGKGILSLLVHPHLSTVLLVFYNVI